MTQSLNGALQSSTANPEPNKLRVQQQNSDSQNTVDNEHDQP